MASGKPVLYCGAGEGANLIAEIKAGIVTPPEDAEALAYYTEKLIDDIETMTFLGNNGRKFVERELAWEKLTQDWIINLKSSLPNIFV